MVVDSEAQNVILRLWLLLHRVRDVLVLCEDIIFREFSLTTEQFSVLAAVKSRGGSLRPIDLALILERSPNSISMLIDRMVKAGLVRRTRDKSDRRIIHVRLTTKGDNALKPATPMGWEFIQKILSAISDKDKHTLANLLETIKCELRGYITPDINMAEIIKNSPTNQPGLYERMIKNIFPSTHETKRPSGKRGNTI